MGHEGLLQGRPCIQLPGMMQCCAACHERRRITGPDAHLSSGAWGAQAGSQHLVHSSAREAPAGCLFATGCMRGLAAAGGKQAARRKPRPSMVRLACCSSDPEAGSGCDSISRGGSDGFTSAGGRQPLAAWPPSGKVRVWDCHPAARAVLTPAQPNTCVRTHSHTHTYTHSDVPSHTQAHIIHMLRYTSTLTWMCAHTQKTMHTLRYINARTHL